MIIQFVGLMVIMAVYNLSGVKAVQEDEWLVKAADTRFENKGYYNSIFTKEDNVTWHIQGDLRSILVQRRSWIYTTDPSVRTFAIKHDHLKNVQVTIYSRGVEVYWDFYFAAEHLVIKAEDKIMDAVIVDVSGTLAVHSEGSFQVGFSIDPATEERDYFAYTSIHPYRCSELFPGVVHQRQTNIRLRILFPHPKYTIFTPNREYYHNYYYPQTIMDNLGFVILRYYDEFKVTDNVRLIVHRVSNRNTVRSQVVPLIRVTELVVHRLQAVLNMTITDLITMVVLPSVRERPMGYIRDYCILDGSIVSTSVSEKTRLIIQCLIQQHTIRSFTTNDKWTQRLFRGIRDYFALIYKRVRELDDFDVMETFSNRATEFFELQNNTRKDKAKFDPENYKVITYLHMLTEQLHGKVDAKALFWNFFNDFRTQRNSRIWWDRTTSIEEVMTNPNKILNFTNVVEIMQGLEDSMDFRKPVDVKMIDFMNGWLKERGQPWIETLLERDNITGVCTITYEARNTCGQCQLSFPLIITLRTRAHYIYIDPPKLKGDPPKKRHVVKKEHQTDEFWLMANSSEAMEVREYDYVCWENRSSTYYFLEVSGRASFRTFYKDQNWKELLRHYTELPVMVRARLISDIQFFHAKELLSWKYVWVVMKRLKREKSIRVWTAAEKMILALEERFRFTALEMPFMDLVLNVTEELYNATRPPNPLAMKLACMARSQICQKEAANRTRIFIDGNVGSFEGMDDLLCAGLRGSDVVFFQHLLTLIKRLDYRGRFSVMLAMTCYQDHTKLYGLLRHAFVLQTFYAPYHMRVMLLINMFRSSRLGSQVVLLFMQNNYATMRDHFTPAEMEELIMSFSGYLKHRFHYRFVKEILKLTGAKSEVVLNKIQGQMRWVKRNEEKLKAFLVKKRKRTIKRMIF